MRTQSGLRRFANNDALLGVVGLGVVLAILVFTYTGAFHSLFERHPDRVVHVQFADTKQLRKGDDVRIDGVREGTVQSIRYSESARASTVTLKLFDDAGTLYADASAGLRFGSLLGGLFYIDLDRGTTGKPALHGAIPAARTFSQIEVDDITGIARGSAREGLRTLPGELGTGLGNPAAVSQTLSGVVRVAPSVAKGVGAVRGQDPDQDIPTLLTQADRTVKALDTPDQELRGVVAGAASLVKTTANRQGDIRATLGRAPATLKLTDLTLTDLDHTLNQVNPLLAKLKPSVPQVQRTVAQLRPVVAGANTLLARARPLLLSLQPAATALASAAKQGLPLITGLRPTIDRLDKTILPFLAQRDPGTGLTVAQAVGPGINGLGGEASVEDDQGHLIRFPVTLGSASFYGLPCQTFLNDPDAAQQVACNSLSDAIKMISTYNPLGKPVGTTP